MSHRINFMINKALSSGMLAIVYGIRVLQQSKKLHIKINNIYTFLLLIYLLFDNKQ